MLLGWLSQQEITCKSISRVHEKVLPENKSVTYAMDELMLTVGAALIPVWWFLAAQHSLSPAPASLSTAEDNFGIFGLHLTS